MFDEKNLMRIEYINEYSKNCKVEMIALYNKRRITEEDVLKAVELEGIETNSNVIFMTKKQFENIFLAEDK